MFKKLSLNLKIVGVLSIFVFACITIATVGLVKIAEINDSLNSLVNVTVRRLVLAKNMDSLINEIKNQEKKFILEESTEGMDAIGKVLDETTDAYLKNINELITIATVNKPALEEAVQKVAEWKEVDLQVRKLALSGKDKEAFAVAKGPSLKAMNEIDVIGDKVIKKAEGDMESESKRTDEVVASTRLLILSVSSILLLVGFVLAFFILKAVNKAIDQVITSLDESSQQVASAAQQIAATSEELSQSTTEQAASLEQTAASVEEMTSMVTKNSDNSRHTSQAAEQTQANAIKGQQTVELMIRSIGDINDANTNIMNQIERSNSQMNEIVQVITEIGNKTKVINEIVFQTKLLSFNASVEAARAGEYGKGFAVVAEEVGNLAEMSGNAAKEISTMLDSSIQKVQGIVQETGTSVQRLIAVGKEKVESGTRIANDCGQVLAEIVKNIDNVSQMAVEISTASNEQAQGIVEISKAMAQLDQVTQQNSASSEEAASAAEELSAQAETLKSGVVLLIETVRGGGGDHPAAVVHTSHAVAKRDSGKKVLNFKKPTKTAKAAKSSTSSSAPVHVASGSDVMPSYEDDRFGGV